MKIHGQDGNSVQWGKVGAVYSEDRAVHRAGWEQCTVGIVQCIMKRDQYTGQGGSSV